MGYIYKELASYEEKDAKLFKGRDSEIQEMYENFINNEYLVCYADSGEGKSSIIEAGLIPILRSNFYYPIRIVFKDKQFKDNNINFDKFVCQTISDEVDKLKEDSSIRVDTIYAKRLTNDKSSEMAEWDKQMIDSYAWLKLRYAQLTIDNFLFTPVLIFDQFEEVFTNPQSQEWTDRFFAWLHELTMDLCPKVIVNDLENKLGTETFPQIATQKHFRAIFSLRSEYIGQLDYWGMQKHYIPQLKSNRYLLRPLTIVGAKEVITQQEGFTGLNDVVEDIVDILRNLQKGKNCVLSTDSKLPCIPALFLSVVCSQAYALPEKELMTFIQRLREEGEGAVERLIGQFYEKAVSECKIPNEDLEVIEELLVNNAGIRQRISSQTDTLRAINFSQKYMEKLKSARLIRVIPEYNRPEESVELIHDCLCSVIKDRKEARKEIREKEVLKLTAKASKLKAQQEDAISGIFMLLLLVFIIWLLSTVYQDKPTFMTLLDLNEDHVVKFYNENLLFNIILGNLVILPVLIYSAVKKLRITSWLSVYGIISNAILLYFFIKDQDKEIGIRTTIGVVAIGVPLTTLIYSYLFRMIGIPRKEEFKTIFSSVPLVIFFLTVSIYLFYLCVFNEAIGLPDPSDSSWGVVVVPLLTHMLIKLVIKYKEKILPLCMLIISLVLLAYNTIDVSPHFPNYVVIVIILCAIIVSIWQYRRLTPLKCAFSSLLQSLVIIVTILCNLGFNPFKIDYSSVSHVYSWKEVIIKNKEKIGIVEACSGDTLIPCVFDSINSKGFMYLSTDKIQHKSDEQSYNGFYCYQKETGISQYQYLYIPSTELYIFKMANKEEIDSVLSDSISYYAAKAYFELCNANISFLLNGYYLSLDSFSSLADLYKYQLKELDRCLYQMETKKNINGKTVSDFNKSFARTFYLCLLKDRIVKKDSINVFSLSQEILPLYFYNSSSDFEITTNSLFNIDFGNFHKSYSTRIKLSDMREDSTDNKIEAWYNYIEFFTLQDMSLNAVVYSSSIEKQIKSIIFETNEKIREMEEVLEKHNKNFSKLNSRTKGEHLSRKEKISLVSQGLKEWLSTYKKWEKTKQSVYKKLSDLDEERIQIDMDFRQLINKVFLVLPSIVTESQNLYNANFVNICELLYMVAAIRLYDMSSVYLQELEYMDGAKMVTYKEFKNTQKEKDNIIQKIRNMANQLKK